MLHRSKLPPPLAIPPEPDMDIASSAVNAVAATAAAHDSPALADVQAQDAALARTAAHGLYDPSREHDACGEHRKFKRPLQA